MHIHINSLDRSSGTNEDFTVDFAKIAGFASKGGGRFDIKHIEVPITFYQIRPGTNNLFHYIDVGSGHTYPIYVTGNSQGGSPSASQGLTFILSQLNANTDGAVWTGTLSTVTAKYTFTSTLASQFVFYSNTLHGDPETSDVVGAGFVDGQQGTINIVANTAFTMPNLVSYNTCKYLYVRSNLPTTMDKDYDSHVAASTDIIAKIPINVSPFSVLVWEPKVLSARTTPFLNGNIRFYLTYENGTAVSLNGESWSFTMDFVKS